MGLTECDSTSATTWDTLDLSPGITAGSTEAILSVKNTSDIPTNSSLANGQNSFNCSEESCNNPFADSIITFESIYTLCSEEAGNMVFQKGNKTWLNRKHSEESKIKISKSCMGRPSPNKGRKFPSEYGQKISKSLKGRLAWNKGKKGIYSEETLTKMSNAKKGKPLSKEHIKKMTAHLIGKFGEENYNWNGGKKLARIRHTQKHRGKGFILLTSEVSYNEPIEYHHIHPDLPYVIPCPTRIHQMFLGKTHFQNVNAMLGFKLEVN